MLERLIMKEIEGIDEIWSLGVREGGYVVMTPVAQIKVEVPRPLILNQNNFLILNKTNFALKK